MKMERRVSAPAEPSRRNELEDLRRKDLAAALARLGVSVDWRQHPLRELMEWRARAEAGAALRVETGVQLDWRSQSLDRLLELRLRAGRAAELQARFGVNVDWQRYTLPEMDAMAKTLGRLGPGGAVAAMPGKLLTPTFVVPTDRRAATGRDSDGVIQPTFTARAAARMNERDPDAVIRPRFNLRPTFQPDERDPDAVIRPRFAARPATLTAGNSPDDLMSPTFGLRRPPLDRSFRASDPDDLIDPR